MKRFWAVFLLLSLGACSQNPVKPIEALSEGPLSLVVNVEGINCCEGVIRLAVYNDSSYWLSDSNMVRGRLSFVVQQSQTYEIHGLPAGKYAVVVFQDADNDNELDRWLGLFPKEPYGFSNNVGKYGPASFESAAFDLVKDEIISIELN